LDVDVTALFEGMDRQIQADIRKRAGILCRSLERQPQSARRDRKITRLKDIVLEKNSDDVQMMY
jgi:hypothetical protein